MYSVMLPYCILIIFSVSVLVKTQDCNTTGEQCRDNYACCGGCCKGGVCVDTYTSCNAEEDPCLLHTCPPGFECYMYQPRECDGCSSLPSCREEDTKSV